jgi:biotin operon repressor
VETAQQQDNLRGRAEKTGLATCSPSAQRVYHAIGAYAFGEAEAWPSQDRIAEDLGVSREHVNRMVRELREAGCLTVDKRWGRRGWLHNVYQLLEPWGPATQRFIRSIVSRAKRRVKRPITLTGVKPRSATPNTLPNPAPVAPRATMGRPLLT